MEIKQVLFNSEEYQLALRLRDQLLRLPLGMSIYDDPLDQEKEDCHIVVLEDNKVIGTCFYRYIDNHCVQMKQVAIDTDKQGQQIGKTMFVASLPILKSMGVEKIIVHARVTALGFYQKLGFIEYGEPFVEVGIKHYSLFYRVAF